jgi:hypothetical protein
MSQTRLRHSQPITTDGYIRVTEMRPKVRAKLLRKRSSGEAIT